MTNINSDYIKLVEKYTEQDSVENNYNILHQTIMVPVIDKFTLTLRASASLSSEDAHQLKDRLKQLGLKTSFSHKEPKRIKSLTNTNVFSLNNSGQFSFSICFNGNGHQLLTDHGFKLSTDMDGYRNVLHNSDDYLNRDLLKLQLKTIFDYILKTYSVVANVISLNNFFAPEWQVEARNFELSYHYTSSKLYMGQKMIWALDNARSIYQKVGIVSAKKDRLNKSFFAQADIEFKMKCYLKLTDVLRVEYILETMTIGEKNADIIFVLDDSIKTILKKTLITQKFFKDFMAFDYKKAEVTFDAAFKAVQASCSKKAFGAIYERLIQGDGEMRVKSSEGYIYRNIKPLLENGILIRGFNQSEYTLTPIYRKLVSEHSSLNNFTKTNQANGENEYEHTTN